MFGCKVLKLDGVNLALDDGSVPISWLIVTDPLSLLVALEATLPHVVGGVGWVHNPGAAREKVGVVPLLVEVLWTSPALTVEEGNEETLGVVFFLLLVPILPVWFQSHSLVPPTLYNLLQAVSIPHQLLDSSSDTAMEQVI